MTQTNVAIVTGGSAGIGAEICRSMLDAGYEVISMARRAADFSHPRLHNVQVDLLDAAALEVGRLELHRTPVDLAEIVRATLGELESAALAKAQTLEVVAVSRDASVL